MTPENHQSPKPTIIDSVPGITRMEPQAAAADSGADTIDNSAHPTGRAIGDGEPEISNYGEAKAYKKWQDAQQPEAQAAAEAMEQHRKNKAAEQAAQLALQQEMIDRNPDAITEVPKF